MLVVCLGDYKVYVHLGCEINKHGVRIGVLILQWSINYLPDTN